MGGCLDSEAFSYGYGFIVLRYSYGWVRYTDLSQATEAEKSRYKITDTTRTTHHNNP